MIARSVPAPQDQPVARAADGARRLAVVPAEDAKPRDVEELCEQFVLVCESAVDPLEIASALEFDGMNDQLVRKLYGVSDVFALAEEMYRRVPRRPAEPEPVADPWQISKIRPALHGLLYGLPTICFPAAAGLLSGQGVLRGLVIALLTSWALSQGLAYLGYSRLSRSGAAQAARVLLAGMITGAGAVGLVMALTGLTGRVPVGALVFGFGLGAYMLGATVLMVLGADRALLVVLAPAVLGSAAFLALGRPPQLDYAIWGALAATPALALGLAGWLAGRESSFFGSRRGRHAGTRQPAGRLITAAELRGALVAAGLLVFPVVAGLAGQQGPNTGALLAALPLALSMGAAEWLLVWFRRRTQRLLRATRKLTTFAFRARLVLFAALLQYLTAAVLLTVAVVAVAAAAHLIRLDWALAPEVAAYLALGGAMFAALLLQAFGIRILPLIACAVALVFEIIWRRLGVPGQLVACTELLVLLTAYAALMLSKAVRHAC